MADVWVAMPTARLADAEPTIDLWQYKGYRVAVFVDTAAARTSADLMVAGIYTGYGAAINRLCAAIGDRASHVVAAADDLHPHMSCEANRIAAEFDRRFGDGFGVMQPTGDEYGLHDRVCQSPWLGRAWITQAYGGRGPMWPDYYHYFVDQDLHDVAAKLGVLCKRPDLSQYHDHWARHDPRESNRPLHLADAKRKWEQDRALYEARRAAGFPDSDRAT